MHPSTPIHFYEWVSLANGINIPDNAITRLPSIPLHDLNSEDKIDQFLDTFTWMLEEIKRFTPSIGDES